MPAHIFQTLSRVFFFSLIILGVTIFALSAQAEEETDTPLAYVLEVKGVISPATYDLIHRHLERAEKAKADVIVLEMHTPGGLYDSMQDIIQDILDSPIPVVTYVSPAGSHAASAGTYILYASHIAAMSPSTNIGAATPIQMGAPDGQKQGGKEKNSTPSKSTLESKMVNDAAAYIRGLAELRKRNMKWAEEAVRDATSLTASEALSQKVIDVIASDIPSLLTKIDGKTVKMAHDNTRTLKTKGAKVERFVPDWRTQLLDIISHPNVAFMLMTLGMYGLIYELANPGILFPGIFGSICLLLGLFAMNILPINYAGLALILLGIGLMAGEAITPLFGVLGIGGATAFALGASLLIDSNDPSFGIDLWLIAAMTVVSFGFLSVMLAVTIKSFKSPKTTGVEELMQATGEVIAWSQGAGEVHITGEVWSAVSYPGFILKKGDKVKVTSLDGLTLTVTPDKD